MKRCGEPFDRDMTFNGFDVWYLLVFFIGVNHTFSLEKDLILISNNVVLEKPGFNLKADRVEIDLITKNSKIFMNDSTKKVIAIGKNE